MNKHWLFWPFIFFTLQLIVYLFFFSSQGYIAYHELEKSKERLQNNIQALEIKKEDLKRKKELLKDDRRAYEKFREELLLNRDPKVEIIKFKDESENVSNAREEEPLLPQWQRLYIIIGGVFQIGLFFAYYYTKRFKQKLLTSFH